MKNIVVVGSLSFDLVMRVPRRPQKGETIIGNDFQTFVGGKGNNQALAAARAGATVSMIGKVGSDSFGNQIHETLLEAGVDARFLFRDSTVSTGIADILVGADGDNSICIAPQANGRLHPDDIITAASVIKASGIMLLQLEIPINTVFFAAKLAKENGLNVILNPAPCPENGILSPELLALVDILTPNQSEAELLTGIAVTDLRSAMEAATKLQSLGIKQVIITMGELGALLVKENQVATMIPAFTVEAVDSTAAGDAFCGSLAAALAREADLEKAVVYGCAAGALATTKLGAEPSLPKQTDIEALVKSRLACLEN